MSLSTLLNSNRPFASASAGAANAPDERERLMAEFGITYNGRHYEYDIYRYDHLADAVNYARLQRAKPPGEGEGGSMRTREVIEAPTESQRQLMAELGITYQDGVYRFGTYRYDRLADAVNYARLQGNLPARP
ncbi:MAG TPA: hypothetical protein VFR86_24120 [Burkholderiaceae bacterium]|nr:hypothetical protein [Burkholderiaceae bacterium]